MARRHPPHRRSAVGAHTTLRELFGRLPEGWSEVVYDGARWGVTLTTTADGRVLKVYAERLGGPGIVSANLYLTGADRAGEELRPCEMPAEIVLDFLQHLRA